MPFERFSGLGEETAMLRDDSTISNTGCPRVDGFGSVTSCPSSLEELSGNNGCGLKIPVLAGASGRSFGVLIA